MSVELIRPFGPSIAKVKIPKQLVDSINEYVDNIISNEQKAKELSAGSKLAGDVTQEFKLEQEFSLKVGWLDFISKSVFQWINMSRNVSIKETMYDVLVLLYHLYNSRILLRIIFYCIKFIGQSIYEYFF